MRAMPLPLFFRKSAAAGLLFCYASNTSRTFFDSQLRSYLGFASKTNPEEDKYTFKIFKGTVQQDLGSKVCITKCCRQVDLAWKVFDRDLDGYISKVEFQRMASKSNISK